MRRLSRGLSLISVCVSILALAGCAQPTDVGQTIAPEARLTAADGQTVDLADRLTGKPTVLVFYRGAWCEYCMNQLEAIQSIHGDLTALGYQAIALSPDRPAISAQTAQEHGLTFTLLSDPNLAVAQPLGLALQVSDERYRQLRDEFQIDLEAYSGRSHHKFPQSAILLLDQARTVRWRHANPDATVQVPAQEILAAARAHQPR